MRLVREFHRAAQVAIQQFTLCSRVRHRLRNKVALVSIRLSVTWGASGSTISFSLQVIRMKLKPDCLLLMVHC